MSLHKEEFLETTSFLGNNNGTYLGKEFIVSSPKYFPTSPTLRNRILTHLFGITDGVIFISEFFRAPSIRILLETLVKTGLIEAYYEGPIFNDYPKFSYVGLSYAKEPGGDTETTWGYCLPDEDSEIAFSKALGEFLERDATYFSPTHSKVTIPKLTHGDASYLYPYIPKFSHYQTAQNSRLVGSAEDMKHMAGFKAPSLTGDRSRFFPFETFYWGQTINASQKLMTHTTTSGSGGGNSLTVATLSALYELIERDHFMLYWFAGIPPNTISHNDLPGPLSAYVKRAIAQYGLEIHFLDTTYDVHIPSAVCIVIDPVLNIIGMGAKTNMNAEAALRGALLEALAVITMRRYKKTFVSEEKLRAYLAMKPFTQDIDRNERMRMYASPYGIDIIRNAFLGGKEISFTTFAANGKEFSAQREELAYTLTQLETLVKEKGAGYHTYRHIFSSSHIRNFSYHVVHVFIPSFLKLHLHEQHATPLSPRLTEFAREHRKTISCVEDVNPLPHFFP